MIDLEVKKAITEVSIHPLLESRWSPRSFQDKVVDKHSLHKIFEAARWSPSSSNEQPWRFIAGIKGEGETWQKIYDVLDDGNRMWCIFAPVLLIAVSKTHYTRWPDVHNRHRGYDLGQSVAHLTFQAMHEGVYVHQMAGYYPEKAKAAFQIPDDFESFTVIALGYLDSPEKLDEHNAHKETEARNRRAINESVFTESWGKSLDFADNEPDSVL